MEHLTIDQFSEVFSVEKANYQIFSDFDGTLVHSADAPHKIYVDKNLPKLLIDIAGKHSFCLVTGRSVGDLSQYIAIEEVNVLGSLGAEFSAEASGITQSYQLSETLLAVEKDLSLELFAFPGVYIEEKPYSLCIHYHNFQGDILSLKTKLQHIRKKYDGDVKLFQRNKLFELSINVSDKGKAVRHFIHSHGGKLKRNVTNIFIGDGITDEEAFNKVNAINGISVRVGFNPDSSAKYYLDDVEEVHALLTYFSNNYLANKSRKIQRVLN